MTNILRTTNTSSHSPTKTDSSAIPNARPPADNVPNPRLNPLLRVAPASKDKHKVRINLKQASYQITKLEKECEIQFHDSIK